MTQTQTQRFKTTNIKQFPVINGPSRAQTHRFVDRWRELEVARKTFDFDISTFCRDVRACWGPPPTGDQQFMNWCVQMLDITVYQAKELLTRATAAAVVTSANEWQAVGGFRSISATLHLSKEEQVAVIKEAKEARMNIRTVLRKRNAEIKTHVLNKNSINNTAVCTKSVGRDLTQLARWVHKNVKSLPADIRVVVDMYK